MLTKETLSRRSEPTLAAAPKRRLLPLAALGAAALSLAFSLTTLTPAAQAQDAPSAANASETHVALVFSGGHDTDPRDRGRPVVLVAGALGVAPEVFREAFSHVHPAGPNSGGPTPEEARANKAALMDALGKYGITNDRLDTVSNYYRYVRSRGEHWPAQAATGYAVVEKGKVTRFVITSGGSGYSSAPTVSVANMPDVVGKAKLSFSKVFAQNGAVSEVSF